VNDLSPAYIRIRYHVGSHKHVQTLGCRPASEPVPGVHPSVLTNADADIEWDVAVNALCALQKVFLKTTAQFDIAEFWSKPTPDDAPVFIDALPIGVAGTSTADTLVAGEFVMTFRTAHRGGLRLYLMEPAAVENEKQYNPFTNAAADALADYIIGSDGWILARNNDKPLVALTYTTKVNDVLRDKYIINP